MSQISNICNSSCFMQLQVWSDAWHICIFKLKDAGNSSFPHSTLNMHHAMSLDMSMATINVLSAL